MIDDDPVDFDDDPPEDFRSFRKKSSSPSQTWLFAVSGAALLGALFSAISTRDFVNHLDRQVHAIHCSFIPGAGPELGESGCRTVMMSPYSSILRESLWGGLPISLLALAVFSYLVFRAASFALSKREPTKRETWYLILATLLPVLMSVIYGTLSAVKIGEMCKLCVGVYIASGGGFVFAMLAHKNAKKSEGLETSTSKYVTWFGQGVAYVAALVVAYLAFVPESTVSKEGCGVLATKEDPSGIMIPYGSQTPGGVESIAVLDPLCPACRSFDERLDATGVDERLSMKAVLFPLDSSCNWMVKDSIHPGACAVSEAILCDKAQGPKIIEWAFENQEALMQKAKQSDDLIRKAIVEQFPNVNSCFGSASGRAKIKNKVNKSLRWAVANALPVLTPQLFIGERRVCDEDTDLGLEYTVSSMLAQAKR